MTKENNPVVLSINTDIDTSDQRIKEWKEEYINIILAEKKSDLEERLKDIKKGTNLWNEYQNEIEDINEKIKMSPKEYFNENEDEFYDWFYSQIEISIELFLEDVDNFFKDDYYLITGSAGLWNGTQSVYLIKRFHKFEDFYNNLNDVDNFSCKIYKNGKIEWEHTHHDGGNHYELYPLESLDKKELIEVIKNHYNDEKTMKEEYNEWSKNNGGQYGTFSSATKENLYIFLTEYVI